MNMPTVEMPRAKAREAFVEYQRAVRERHSQEDEEIMRAYRALAQGRVVIDIQQAIRDGGEDAKRLPRIAIARADERQISVRRSSAGDVMFYPADLRWPRQNEAWGRRFRIEQALPWLEQGVRDHVTIVPNIPPHLRPPHDLRNYHLLFEADWRLADLRAPGDPALLKHLGGDLFAVLATWELTEVEKLVLGITRA